MTIAGVVLKRDRLMGIGQMITMPLFFASSALYPVHIMPGWLQWLSRVEPAQLRGRRACADCSSASHADLPLDFGVLALSVVVGIATSAALVGRLAR